MDYKDFSVACDNCKRDFLSLIKYIHFSELDDEKYKQRLFDIITNISTHVQSLFKEYLNPKINLVQFVRDYGKSDDFIIKLLNVISYDNIFAALVNNIAKIDDEKLIRETFSIRSDRKELFLKNTIIEYCNHYALANNSTIIVNMLKCIWADTVFNNPIYAGLSKEFLYEFDKIDKIINTGESIDGDDYIDVPIIVAYILQHIEPTSDNMLRLKYVEITHRFALSKPQPEIEPISINVEFDKNDDLVILLEYGKHKLPELIINITKILSKFIKNVSKNELASINTRFNKIYDSIEHAMTVNDIIPRIYNKCACEFESGKPIAYTEMHTGDIIVHNIKPSDDGQNIKISIKELCLNQLQVLEMWNKISVVGHTVSHPREILSVLKMLSY